MGRPAPLAEAVARVVAEVLIAITAKKLTEATMILGSAFSGMQAITSTWRCQR